MESKYKEIESKFINQIVLVSKDVSDINLKTIIVKNQVVEIVKINCYQIRENMQFVSINFKSIGCKETHYVEIYIEGSEYTLKALMKMNFHLVIPMFYGYLER